jgi:hypothetical protein
MKQMRKRSGNPARILTKKTVSNMPALNTTKSNRIFKHLKSQGVSSEINASPAGEISYHIGKLQDIFLYHEA